MGSKRTIWNPCAPSASSSSSMNANLNEFGRFDDLNATFDQQKAKIYFEDLEGSIGVALYNGHPDHQYLIKQSDEAMYQAKALGSNRVILSV